MSEPDTNPAVSHRDHPAVRAWRQLGDAPVVPDQVAVLKKGTEGSVYRLVGRGLEHGGFIAKRARREKAKVERGVYEGVLSKLSLRSIRYHGYVEEDDARYSWLFLEDVGDEQYAPAVPEHRHLAGEWLGALHAAVEHKPPGRYLAERGPDFYQAHLRSIASTLPKLQAVQSISSEGSEVLDAIRRLCQHLDSHWGKLEAYCAPIPRTLVHGDCLPKNVHIQKVGKLAEVRFFDWGGAGWGLAGTDLGLLALPYDGPPSFSPDYHAYLRKAQQRRPSLDLETIGELMQIGQLFWALKVIDKSFPALDYPSPSIVSNFRLYASTLARSMEAISWGPPPSPAIGSSLNGHSGS